MELNEEKVSVLLPTHNRANLLGRAIRSVLSQTYKNLELIIIDDFSIDNTQAVISHYSRMDDRIVSILNHQNMGLAKTRNRGLEIAKGVYLATLDDDDEWIDTNKLIKQLKVCRNGGNEIGIVATGIKQYSSSQEFKIKNPVSFNMVNRLLIGNSLIYTSTALFPTMLIKSLRGFDERMPKGIDSDLYRRIILRSKKKVVILPDVTVAVHEYGSDRITNSKTKVQVQANIVSTFLTILKFWDILILNPKAIIYRAYVIVKNCFILLAITLSR